MEKLYSALSVLIVVMHGVLIGYFLLGGPILLLVKKRIPYWYPKTWLIACVLILTFQITFRECPLTWSENFCRKHAGWETYSEGFINHYLHVSISDTVFISILSTLLTAGILFFVLKRKRQK